MIRFLVRRKLISTMSILTENLVMLEHKQGEMLDNLWISSLFRRTVAPLGLMIATKILYRIG